MDHWHPPVARRTSTRGALLALVITALAVAAVVVDSPRISTDAPAVDQIDAP